MLTAVGGQVGLGVFVEDVPLNRVHHRQFDALSVRQSVLKQLDHNAVVLLGHVLRVHADDFVARLGAAQLGRRVGLDFLDHVLLVIKQVDAKAVKLGVGLNHADSRFWDLG